MVFEMNDRKRPLHEQNKMFILLTCLMILLLIVPLSANSNAKSLSQYNLPVFQFTGHNFFENYDYNNDGHGDLVILSFGVDVTTPGMVLFHNICINSVIYWNTTSSSNSGASACNQYINSQRLINLDKTGPENISIWFTDGYLFHSLTYNTAFEYMNNANMSVTINMNPVYSNGLLDSNVITSQMFNFSISQISNQNLLQNTDLNNFGAIDPSTSLITNQFTNGRSITDQYKWTYFSMFNTSLVKHTFNGFLSVQFLNFSSSFVNLNMTEIYINGTLYYHGTYQIYIIKKMSTNIAVFQYLIPKNTSIDSLKAQYNFIWFGYTAENQFTKNYKISYESSKEYFLTNYSYNDYATISGAVSLINLSTTVIYHLPTGLLSYLNVKEYINSSLFFSSAIKLISPNFGVTSIPNNSTPSIANTNNSLPTTTSNSKLSTTSFGLTTLSASIPLATYALVFRKKKNKKF